MEKLVIGISPTASIEITADSPKEIIQKAAFWMTLPAACPVCERELVLTYRTPDKFKYYGLRCLGNPSHASSFGQYQDGDGLFYKTNDKWTLWLSGENGEPSAPAAHSPHDSSASASPPASLPPAASVREDVNRFDGPEYEPRAEHERLDKLIASEWAKEKRAVSYADSVQKRYGMMPERLRIKEKREILEKLLEANGQGNHGR